MVQSLKALIALRLDLGVILITHMVAQNHLQLRFQRLQTLILKSAGTEHGLYAHR